MPAPDVYSTELVNTEREGGGVGAALEILLLDEELERIYGSLGERVSFFKGIVTGRLTTVQWMVLHLGYISSINYT